MFRLWCKLFDNSNHMIKDMVAVNDDPELNRTRKIFDGIKEACYEFDLSEPMWFDSNIADFKRHSKVRFTSDNFIDDRRGLTLYSLISRFTPLSPINAVSSSPPSACPISHLLAAARSASSLSAMLLCTLVCFDVSG